MLTMNKVEYIPEDVSKDILQLSDLVSESVIHMSEVAKELRLIVESAFSPMEVKQEDERVSVVEKEEQSSDILGLEIGKQPFWLPCCLLV